MRRIIFLLTFLSLPSLAHAQFQHASFFNGGTTLTATCTATTGTNVSSDVFLGTLQGNTAVTLPASAIGCLDYDVIDLRATQGTSSSFTFTVNAGTGTTTKITSNNGNIITMPTAGSVSNVILHQIWVYNAVASTPQWELVTQETQPVFNLNNLGSVTGSQTCNFALGPVCQITATGAITLTMSNLPTNAPIWVVVGRNASATGFNITWPANAIAEIGSNGSEALGSMNNASWPTNAAAAGSGPLFTVYPFWSDGTNAYLMMTPNATFNKIQVNNLGPIVAGETFNADNTVNSMSRMPLTFGTGNLTLAGLNGNNFAVYKVVKALTLENIEGVSIVDSSCAAGSVITIYDCGSSAPANAACSGGTAKANVTLSTTVGSAADGTVSSANVAAGEYLGAQISTIGTSCTVLNAVVTLMARPQ